MIATTANFSKSSLWPPNPRAVVLRSSNVTDPETGEGLGPGLLKLDSAGNWLVFEQRAGRFVQLDTDNKSQMFQANMRSRFGDGWQFGQSQEGGHASTLYPSMWAVVHPGVPVPPDNSMEGADLCFTGAFDDLEREFKRIMAGSPTADQDALDARTDPPKPAPPAKPPAVKPPAPPDEPISPPQGQGRAIDIDFTEDLVVHLPSGASGALFEGSLTLPAALPGGIKPLIKVALGAVDGQRVNAGLFKITREQTFGLEWDPDETRPAGGKAASGAISFEWTPGLVHVKTGGKVRAFTTNPATAAEGGVIVFGIDPPKPGKPAEYVRLLGGRLRGTLKITGGAAEPVNPPLEPQPPAPGAATIAEALAQARKLVKTLEALK